MKNESRELIKKTLSEVIKNFYALDGNSGGGELHVVLDDVNISESMLIYYINKEKLGDIEKLICIALLSLDAKERAEICYDRKLSLDEALSCLDEDEDSDEILELRKIYGE